MRDVIKDFVAIISHTLPINEPVYEFGSLQCPGQEVYADLRPFFKGKEYVGCDIQEGPGVDKIANLCNVDMPNESAGTILVMETLEHIEFDREAIKEAYRLLKPNGLLAISSEMKFPIHNYPDDYWRFTPSGFRSLLRPFPFTFVESAGEENFPHTIIGIGYKGKGEAPPGWKDFLLEIKQWKERWSASQMSSWKSGIVKWIPPIAVPIAVKAFHFFRYKLRRSRRNPTSI